MDPAAYTFGNLPRSAPFGLFAPYLLDEDASVRREFVIHEKKTRAMPWRLRCLISRTPSTLAPLA